LSRFGLIAGEDRAPEKNRYREHIQRKETRRRKLNKWEQQDNRKRFRIRFRVEHIFGGQAQRAGNLILCGIGLIRAAGKIGLRKLAFNLDRYPGRLCFQTKCSCEMRGSGGREAAQDFLQVFISRQVL